MSEQTMCYAAHMEGEPGFYAVCVDKPEWAKDTAKTISQWVKEGGAVVRVTLDEAKAGLSLWMESQQ